MDLRGDMIKRVSRYYLDDRVKKKEMIKEHEMEEERRKRNRNCTEEG